MTDGIVHSEGCLGPPVSQGRRMSWEALGVIRVGVEVVDTVIHRFGVHFEGRAARH